MRTNRLRTCVICLVLLGATAALSSAIARACTSSGCTSGCKVSSTWCNASMNLGYNFGTGVVMPGSCALSPDGGSTSNYALRSYDVYDACSSECPSDTMAPGTISGARETIAQGMYFTQCSVGIP